MTKCISYLRVSTARQGLSGLGLEAQRVAVQSYLGSSGGTLLEEFVEVESGKSKTRPNLREALAACRLHGATLVVAKLDRLSRNAAFLLNLQDAGVRFVAADNLNFNELVVGILAVVAQAEGKLISERTRQALAAAKARGVRLGCPRPITRLAQINGAQASLKVRKAAALQYAVDVKPRVLEAYSTSGSLRER